MIQRIPSAQRYEGEGAQVRRLFPTLQQRTIDPFVLFDEFDVVPPAHFPDHPHSGFEAVTYLMEGGFRHRDNLGNDSTVLAGGAQRFTAGSGIVHAEYPIGDRVHGLQLWIVLPQALKGIEPSYQAVPQLAWETYDGVYRCWIVGGSSPIQLHTPVEYLAVRLSAGHQYWHMLPSGWQGFAYVLQGEVRLNDVPLRTAEGAVIREEEQLFCTAVEDARWVLAIGKPWQETIRLYGGSVL
ncbi:MAG: pirin family protein [Chlorobiota bacterium]